MKNVYLAYKAYDIHELLCHAIADAAGLYARAGLSVKLLDSTFTPDDALPENTFHAACGAALASFLTGQQRKVVFVACDRPMFWLYGRAGVDSVAKLAQGRVATFPDVAPPSKFLQRYLREAGVAPGLLPCRDDTSRLGLLSSCSVDGALISSNYLPHEVEARGPVQLAFLGDTLRLPSTGLAVASELHQSNPQLVADMVKVYQEAMKLVFDDDQTVLRLVLEQAFDKSAEGLDSAIQVIRHCYNPFGYSYENVLQEAIDGFAAGMGLASRSSRELYEFKYIKSHN
jgi:ABC-type nitrate/sulfonate/bicarbonate transport system substrate-binding protein